MNSNFSKKALFLSAVLFSCAAISQTKEEPKLEPKVENPTINFALEGMIGVAVGNNAVGINVGGPSLKLKLKNYKIGVGAFPSLLILNGEAAPRLAVSPIVEYKKWMLITPYYGYDTDKKMIWTFGIGYKFK
ncbi:hypothetical protein J2X31_000615 [Flavobacterium arsenatis]|uniref:Lipoprotein n=1 Tax=Flavobacterium arsenatis TaxID=1484332 RepID=A0ABU1TKW1_9FLAO|nr:hypothetical protein [Flavobacterium arsenatis]MDR6966617.1 hypothetical protein [Flavobacterium arsenatis]